MGALGRGGHMEILQCEPWLSMRGLRTGARTGMGGGPIHIIGSCCRAGLSPPRYPRPGDQANSIVLSQKISLLAEKLGQDREGEDSAE